MSDFEEGERLVTIGLRIKESKKQELLRIASLVNMKPSEVGRWIFDEGWSRRDEVIRSKAKTLLNILGESLETSKEK